MAVIYNVYMKSVTYIWEAECVFSPQCQQEPELGQGEAAKQELRPEAETQPTGPHWTPTYTETQPTGRHCPQGSPPHPLHHVHLSWKLGPGATGKQSRHKGRGFPEYHPPSKPNACLCQVRKMKKSQGSTLSGLTKASSLQVKSDQGISTTQNHWLLTPSMRQPWTRIQIQRLSHYRPPATRPS